jgi:hypothetical protein
VCSSVCYLLFSDWPIQWYSLSPALLMTSIVIMVLLCQMIFIVYYQWHWFCYIVVVDLILFVVVVSTVCCLFHCSDVVVDVCVVDSMMLFVDVVIYWRCYRYSTLSIWWYSFDTGDSFIHCAMLLIIPGGDGTFGDILIIWWMLLLYCCWCWW